ncbi:MAG: Cof-type HAD-IIB family hydrolase [Bacilli bacterium]|nr:Cof-type HAD-IIB family hydrolase [Bacilli bacterium]
MNKKIVFFDVDGTLVDVRPAREYIPDSTVEAVRKTRENGNLCFLCTGRSKAEIYSHIMEVGFDGIIGAGGGFVEIGNDMLYHKKVGKDAINHVVDFFEEHGFDYYIESNGGLYASKNLVPRLEFISYGDLENDPEARKKKEEAPSHFIPSLKQGYDLHRDDVNKICFLEKEGFPFEKIYNEFKDEFNVIHCTVPMFGDDSGELSVPGVNKASAIESLINHLGIPKENTYAFGDGMNDADMLEYCQYGIAVGNAKEGLKAIANEITDDIAEDGIYNSMKKHGLI